MRATIRENVRCSTDELLFAHALKVFTDSALVEKKKPLIRSDVFGLVLLGILATVALLLAFN